MEPVRPGSRREREREREMEKSLSGAQLISKPGRRETGEEKFHQKSKGERKGSLASEERERAFR